ncbi:MAG TPA: translation initiation factor IF-2 [Chromatiales bacterium]|nr:translation initiation factor IF-2 [Thiotrichales bacterium]HIP68217.1 translation initiation factor IF-2 [Chromatiales bacterium]
MSNVTVKQLAEVIKTPIDKLIVQLNEAGISVEQADDAVTDEQKMKLLAYLRQSHGKTGASAPSGKITLKRKRKTELKVGASGGRAKTVSVEVRKKRTYTKPEEQLEVEAETTTAAAPVKSKVAELAKQVEAERKAVQEASRKSKEEAQRKADEAAQRKAEREQKELEEKQKAEESVQRKEVEEARRKEEEQKRAAAEATKDLGKDKKKKAGGKQAGTRYGRNELHVAANKGRRRKTKSRARRQPVVDVPTKHGFEMPTEPVVREVEIPETISVGDLGQQMAVKSSEVIKALMGMGVMATINQVLDHDTATLVVEEMGHKPVTQEARDAESQLSEIVAQDDREQLPRAPVVTIMGHVDHGKTSLLDHIRRSRVAAGEAGGITQHIGAYHVETDKGGITFLDTPGHAAFTSMRARGAQVTDVVILVVAADDGVMPQTIEAIEHARAAGVPLVVAVNKIDKPEADPDRVRNELSKYEVIPEEWGGDNIFVNVSAQTGEGIDDLLEAVLLTVEVLELKAPVTGAATGTVVEASLEKGRGPVATILVTGGTLKQGDIIISGEQFGRVRAMVDENGNQLKQAGPSTPVVVLGLSGTPNAGDDVQVVKNERKAREIAELRKEKNRESKLASQQAARLENLFSNMKDGEKGVVSLLIKADVQGSAEALRDSLTKLSTDEVSVKLVSTGVGGITESDVNLAHASQAIVIGFNVRADATARRQAEDNDVDIRYYSVIYDVIDDVKQALSGLLSPEVREEIIGIAEVKDVFKSSSLGAVAGCMVIEGSVKRGNPIRVLRDNVVIYEGELESLRRHKDDVNEVRAGTECGIAVKNYNDVKVGDQIENFERVEVQREL